MRILILTNMYPSKKTSYFGIFVKEQVEALVSNGARVLLIKNSDRGKSALVVTKKYTFIFLKTLSVTLFKKFDIIHAHYIFPTGTIALIPKILRRKKLIITCHRGDVYNVPQINKICEFLTKKTLQWADRIIAVSDDLRNEIMRNYKIPRSKIEVIDMGVNITKFFSVDSTEKKKIRKSLNIATEKTIILYVGFDFERKGVPTILKALSLLDTVSKNRIHCHFIGTNRIDYFKMKAQELRISNFIHFLTPRSHEEISMWMRASDIFVLPSFSEGMPIALLEAMCSGNAVISSDVGGIPSLIQDGINGILVKPGNENMLVDKLKMLISNSYLRRRIAQRGIGTAKLHSTESNAKKCLDVYSSLVIR